MDNSILKVTYHSRNMDMSLIYFRKLDFFIDEVTGKTMKREFIVFPDDQCPPGMYIEDQKKEVELDNLLEESVLSAIESCGDLGLYYKTKILKYSDSIAICIETGNVIEGTESAWDSDDASIRTLDIDISKTLLEQNQWFRDLIEKFSLKDNAKIYSDNGVSNAFVEHDNRYLYLIPDYELEEK